MTEDRFKTMTKRWAQWVSVVTVAIVTVTLFSGEALAKKRKGEDLGKGDVQNVIKDVDAKDVTERSEEEKKAAAEARKKEIEELGAQPAEMQAAEVDTPEVDPAKVDELLKEIESKNKELIAKFEALLQKSPNNAKAADWMFQIAELKWEVAQYRQLRDMREWGAQLDALEATGTPSEDWPQAPKPDFGEALEVYKKIVASHGTYERLDEVLFKLGDGLVRAGDDKEGVGYLHRITQAYPDSKYLDRVYLSLGEYYFNNRNVGTAQAAYEKIVLEHPQSKVFNYAQYKLGWTYFNTGDDEGFRKAITTFKKVVDTLDAQFPEALMDDGTIDMSKLPQGQVSFRNQAINDLIVAYAEVEGGWLEARDYFKTKMSPEGEYFRKKMEMFAELMGNKGQFQERVDIYRWLIDKDAKHPRIATYAERIIDSHFSDNQKEKIEVVTREFIDYFDPNGGWAIANKDANPREYDQARVFAEDKLYSLAANYLLEANKAIDRNDEAEATKYFQQARTDHEAFLSRYPDSQYAYDMNFYYAYILDENSDRGMGKLRAELGKKPEQFRAVAQERVLPDLKAAAQQYQKVIDLRELAPEDGEDHTRVAANRQVFVYANILATVDPEWSLEASGDAKNFQVEEKDSESKQAEPLKEQETDFVKSAEQYSSLFPTHEDTPGFLWRAAEIYRSRYHYNEAAERFDELVSNFPQHEYAGQAVGSMFALYNKAENWPKIEYWAEWLIEKQNFKVYAKVELEDAVGYSIGNQSKDLYDAKDYRAAAEKLYTLKSRFPERESLVAPAILQTANIYRDGKLLPEAIKKYEEYRAVFPMRAEAPWATFQAALLYNEKTDFEKAAELFEGLPAEVAKVEGLLSGAAATAEADAGKKKGKKGKDDKKAAEADKAAEAAAGGDADVDYRKANLTNQYVALFNAVQIREGLQDWDKAIANAQRYLELNVDGKGDVYEHPEAGYLRPHANEADKAKLAEAKLIVNSEGTIYHLAEIYQMAGRPTEAIAQYQTYLSRFTENKPVVIKAHLEIAKLLGEAQPKGWMKEQDKQFGQIEKHVAALTGDDATRSKTLLAEMKFIQGDRKFEEFKAVKLEFPVSKLRKLVPEKAKLRADAEAVYKQVIDMKVARWSSAAAYRIGEMSLDFRDNFKALPVPPELDPDSDEYFEYIGWIEDELIYPAEDAAAAGFLFAVDLAHQLKVYNEWSRKSAEGLATLRADEYPVTGEKGVTIEHVGDLMIAPQLVLGAIERGPKGVESPADGADDAAPAEGEGPAPAAGGEGGSAEGEPSAAASE